MDFADFSNNYFAKVRNIISLQLCHHGLRTIARSWDFKRHFGTRINKNCRVV